MKNVIEIKKLSKKYSKFELGELSVNIPSGQIIGLIGENGAGKTTLIKSILNIIKINNGSIKIFGKDYSDDSIKEDIGVVLDNSFFPELMTPNDINIVMKNVYSTWDEELYKKYLESFEISLNMSLKQMSKGMRKKTEIAVSLAHKPKLLILDEPTSGLDPVVRSEVLDIFLDFIKDEDHTIILSTHITSDLEQIADRILFIDAGKIVLDEARDDIIDDYAVLKCDVDEFSKIDKTDIVTYKKNKYNCEILIKDKSKLSKKYKNYVIDKITLEELMVLIIKGEK